MPENLYNTYPGPKLGRPVNKPWNLSCSKAAQAMGEQGAHRQYAKDGRRGSQLQRLSCWMPPFTIPTIPIIPIIKSAAAQQGRTDTGGVHNKLQRLSC